jgi:toxin-antitoxin system PIN domain toxin
MDTMLLADVNIYIYAFRPESPQHNEMRDWLQQLIAGDETYGVAEVVLSAFLRIVTNPRAFLYPNSIQDAIVFANEVRNQPNSLVIAPGPRHWDIFTELCQQVGARGNLVPDAYFAALAIESGSEWVSMDRDFSKFPGLRWRHPLE